MSTDSILSIAIDELQKIKKLADKSIEQLSDEVLQVGQGSIYPALMRLEQQGWIATKWGVSETNRKVKFYSLTRAGTKQLHVEVANWEQASALVARFLDAKA